MDQIEKDKLKELLKKFDSDISAIKTKRKKIEDAIDKIEQQRK